MSAAGDDRRRHHPALVHHHDHIAGARVVAEVVALGQVLAQIGAAVGELRVQLIADAGGAAGAAADVQAGHRAAEAGSDVRSCRPASRVGPSARPRYWSCRGRTSAAGSRGRGPAVRRCRRAARRASRPSPSRPSRSPESRAGPRCEIESTSLKYRVITCGRRSAGSRSQSSTVATRSALGMVPSYLFQNVGRMPLIAASDPGQKKQAATMPWRSAGHPDRLASVPAAIGRPWLRSGTNRRRCAPGSKNQFSTIPWWPG